MRRGMLFLLMMALSLAGCGTDEAPAQESDRDGDAAEATASRDGDDGDRADSGSGAGAVCTVAEATRPLPDEIHESSGVAASRAHAGVFWTHNDSGDPVVYAVNAQGQLAGTVRVSGARVEDWEDISLAPCPSGGDCLYVGDIGDNDARRASVTVWRVPEPAPGDAESRPAEALVFRYPDGAHDAEAMFVLDGRVHIVTKGETGPVALYRAPASPAAGQTATLEKVRELASGDLTRKERVTGADASPDGAWIAVRTLEEAAFYPARGFVDGGAAEPRRMDLGELDEAQGEGIGFTADGAVLVTSEGGKKSDPATFARLSCTLN
jgi:hypothetical protein